MSGNDKKDNVIDAIVKDTREEIGPVDSWQALRVRIDQRIAGRDVSFAVRQGRESAIFWRRAALAMAACFVVAAAALVYTIGFIRGGREATAGNEGLFSDAQLGRLQETFSNVRELFGQQLPWIVVGAGAEAEIGIAPAIATADSGKVIIVRLAVSSQKAQGRQRYFDVVTFSDLAATCRLPVAEDGSAVNVFLKPVLGNDGTITVETKVAVNGSSEARSTTTVVDDAFTSLVRLPVDGDWIKIEGIGQSLASI